MLFILHAASNETSLMQPSQLHSSLASIPSSVNSSTDQLIKPELAAPNRTRSFIARVFSAGKGDKKKSSIISRGGKTPKNTPKNFEDIDVNRQNSVNSATRKGVLPTSPKVSRDQSSSSAVGDNSCVPGRARGAHAQSLLVRSLLQATSQAALTKSNSSPEPNRNSPGLQQYFSESGNPDRSPRSPPHDRPNVSWDTGSNSGAPLSDRVYNNSTNYLPPSSPVSYNELDSSVVTSNFRKDSIYCMPSSPKQPWTPGREEQQQQQQTYARRFGASLSDPRQGNEVTETLNFCSPANVSYSVNASPRSHVRYPPQIEDEKLNDSDADYVLGQQSVDRSPRFNRSSNVEGLRIVESPERHQVVRGDHQEPRGYSPPGRNYKGEEVRSNASQWTSGASKLHNGGRLIYIEYLYSLKL